jgi:drug/metabolite transporter (DMT)-like permease
MIYLALAILCTVTINALIKAYELGGANTQVVIASNYVVAGLLGGGLLLARGIGRVDRTTLLLGLSGGLLWPAGFYVQMWGIRRYGLALAGTVSRLSLSIPLLFSLLFLNERLTPAIAIGMAGVFVAFWLLAPLRGGADRALDRRALWYFPLLVVVFGAGDLWANLFNAYGRGSERLLFVVLIFIVAGLFSWAVVGLRRVRVDRGSFAKGLVLGVPNFFTTFFLLESLRAPLFARRSAVVYALYSVVPAVLVFAMGPVIWREKVTRGNLVGALVAVVSIALLNLR